MTQRLLYEIEVGIDEQSGKWRAAIVWWDSPKDSKEWLAPCDTCEEAMHRACERLIQKRREAGK